MKPPRTPSSDPTSAAEHGGGTASPTAARAAMPRIDWAGFDAAPIVILPTPVPDEFFEAIASW